jgi:hypothetical protein
MSDELGVLQQRLLQLSELMVNGLGLVQRNAAPLSLEGLLSSGGGRGGGGGAAGDAAAPLSVEQPEQWRHAAAQQAVARQTFAVSVVATSKAVDELAERVFKGTLGTVRRAHTARSSYETNASFPVSDSRCRHPTIQYG